MMRNAFAAATTAKAKDATALAVYYGSNAIQILRREIE
jgi:hypothetical protein